MKHGFLMTALPISLILWGAVRLFFKDLPLDDADESEDESNG